MDVTYIIPVFGKPELLMACLSSFRKFIGDEPVIVVDDFGSDREELRAVSGIYRAEHIGRSVNGGFAAACNTGIRAAKTKYVCLVNNDIVFSVPLTRTIMECFERDRKTAVLGGLLYYPDGRIQHGGGYYRHPGSAHYGHGKLPHQAKLCSIPAYRWHVTGALMAIEKTYWGEAGGFDETLYNDSEDTDFCLNVWKSGRRIFYEPRFTAIHAEGKTRGANTLEKIKSGMFERCERSRREVLGRIAASPVEEIHREINRLNAEMHPDLPSAFIRNWNTGDVHRALSVYRSLERKEKMIVVTQIPEVFRDEACRAITKEVDEFAWGGCFDLDLAYERHRDLSIEEAYCRVVGKEFKGNQPVTMTGPTDHDWMLVRQAAPEVDWGSSFVVVHAGRHWRSKTLPGHFWNGLLERFVGRGLTVVLVGNGEDFSAKGPGVVDLVGRTGLSMLRALLERASVFVGPDSGPLNMADGACPAIGLFTCALPERIVSKAVTPMLAQVPCVGCLHRQPASFHYTCDYEEGDPRRFRCTSVFDFEEVSKKAMEIMR